MNKLRDWWARFSYGRYGNDQFGRFLVIFALVLAIVSMFTSNWVYIAALAVFIYAYFRIFSKNIRARQKENEWFLGIGRWFSNLFGGRKKNGYSSNRAQNANYKVFKCPKCGQKLRVPRGRGKIEIRCRKCSEIFVRRT